MRNRQWLQNLPRKVSLESNLSLCNHEIMLLQFGCYISRKRSQLTTTPLNGIDPIPAVHFEEHMDMLAPK